MLLTQELIRLRHEELRRAAGPRVQGTSARRGGRVEDATGGFAAAASPAPAPPRSEPLRLGAAAVLGRLSTGAAVLELRLRHGGRR